MERMGNAGMKSGFVGGEFDKNAWVVYTVYYILKKML
jgi:hypothetical protein